MITSMSSFMKMSIAWSTSCSAWLHEVNFLCQHMGWYKRVSRIVFIFIIDIINHNATDVIVFKNLSRRDAPTGPTPQHARQHAAAGSTTGCCSSINKFVGSISALSTNLLSVTSILNYNYMWRSLTPELLAEAIWYRVGLFRQGAGYLGSCQSRARKWLGYDEWWW